MYKYFILTLIVLIIAIILFTVIVYNELIRYRNEIKKSWENIIKLIDEYMNKVLNEEELSFYKNLISVEDIIDYYYKHDSLNDDVSELKRLIIENKRIYNDYVLALNNKIMLFPFNIVASIFGFSKWPYFRD